MRVFALSDIHIDFEENEEWVKSLSSWDYTEDTLILAGDISDVEARVQWCFEIFKNRFRNVFFVPGNHDIWVKSSDRFNSLEKFENLLALAENFEVQTEPGRIGDVMIAPIYSWYDFSFGAPSDYIRKAWMDFRRCRWPSELSDESLITKYFLKRSKPPQGEYKTLITCSHFLPRIDIMPLRIPPKKRELYSVLGASAIDTHIREQGSDIHVYGHSHVNLDKHVDGVRYINNAFAYPNETRIARKTLYYIGDIS